MVQITIKISDRDDTSLDVTVNGQIVHPSSGYEQEIGRAICPKLDELLIWIRQHFPGNKLHITQFDGPLNPPKPKPEEPWKFPGRGEII